MFSISICNSLGKGQFEVMDDECRDGCSDSKIDLVSNLLAEASEALAFNRCTVVQYHRSLCASKW